MTLYRVVQEALTNAAKHAPSTHVQVTLRRDGGVAVVEVINDGGAAGESRVSGAGHGLVGMRERVALYNGTMAASPTPTGGFAVRVTIPIDDSNASSTMVAPA